eukprot:TRINITY_DN8387_c0_g1_i1.p1 TRINITY_DN8387_c0_g1~~TRINITY_DN8387_c0_g1_i1.p1  ORF type:complete len:668 (-),score=121.64 TRINITY_DN8387_c0_g1_i1:32-2035(-)
MKRKLQREDSSGDILAKKKQKLLSFREQLPIYGAKDILEKEFRENRRLILIGETGSGKTTQVPQFMHALFSHPRKGIAVTQPRRLAAMSVAMRVADEMGVEIGTTVGYHVRFSKQTGPETRINFLTDGMLLREAMLDKNLKKYHTIVIDEAHERSLSTDILFGVLKEIMERRQDLRLVIMSATLDAEIFEDYFQAKVLYVQGRQFPVSIYYTLAPEPNYIDAIFITIMQIHMDDNDGDVLVFITGREDIFKLEMLLKNKAEEIKNAELKKLQIIPLYGGLSNSQQQKVFKPTPEGCRKIVLATNIAETSVTVPNITYVIDSGLVKAKVYNEKIGMEMLTVIPVSKAQAKQRAGRAGRTHSGFCYRVYTEQTFNSLNITPIPEIKRANLALTILNLKKVGIDNIRDFQFLERPPISAIKRAFRQLLFLGAMDSNTELTELGDKMSLLPLDPAYSKVLILSKEYRCTNEIMIILSMIATENIFLEIFRENGERPEDVFKSEYGDHIMYLRIFNSFEKTKSKEWCNAHSINYMSMKRAHNTRLQLIDYWKDSFGWDIESCSDEDDPEANGYEAIRKCFTAGFFSNIAMKQPSGAYEGLIQKKKIHIHPTSCLFRDKPDTIVFNDLIFTTKEYMRDIMTIDRDWIADLYPEYLSTSSSMPKRVLGMDLKQT